MRLVLCTVHVRQVRLQVVFLEKHFLAQLTCVCLVSTNAMIPCLVFLHESGGFILNSAHIACVRHGTADCVHFALM